jgi:hypothetical protein
MCLLGTGIGHQKSYVSWAHQSVGQLGRLARGKFLMGRLGRIPTALSAFKLADELVVWGGGRCYVRHQVHPPAEGRL